MKIQKVINKVSAENRVTSSFVFSAGVFINAAIAGMASVSKNKTANITSAFFISKPP